MPLPLLKLPVVVLKCFFHLTDLSAILILSMLNKRLKRVLVAYKYPIRSFTFNLTHMSLLIDTYLNKTEVQIFCDGDYIEDSKEFIMKTENGAMNLAVEVERNKSIVYFKSKMKFSANNDWSLYEWITHFLLEFISSKSFSLTCERDDVNFDDLFIWDITNKFSKVKIYYADRRVPISPEKLEYLLNEIAADELDLAVDSITPGYKYQRPIDKEPNIRKLSLWISDWFDYENFFETFKFPVISCEVPSFVVMNKVLKQWRNGANKVLEDLRLVINSVYTPMRRELVLRGLNSRPSILSMNQIHRRTIRNFFEYKTSGRDIFRRNDRRQATVCIHRHSVTMNVWTKKQLRKISKQARIA